MKAGRAAEQFSAQKMSLHCLTAHEGRPSLTSLLEDLFRGTPGLGPLRRQAQTLLGMRGGRPAVACESRQRTSSPGQGGLQLTQRPLVSTVGLYTNRPAGLGDCGGPGTGSRCPRRSWSRGLLFPESCPHPQFPSQHVPTRAENLTRHPSADRAGLRPRERASHRPQPGRARGRGGGQEAGGPRGQDHR